MPKRQQNNGHCVYSRTFVNSEKFNGVSSNWKTDWKMVSGVSYATVVKMRNNYFSQADSGKLVSNNNQRTQVPEVRTRSKRVEGRASDPRKVPLTKRSDVSSTLQSHTTIKAKCDKVVVPNEHTSVPLHNRFNILSNIDLCESNMNDQNENIDTNVDFVNKNKPANDDKPENPCVYQNRKLTVEDDCSGEHKYSKKVNISATYQGNTVSLVENDDKYDLELKFKPRHRQRITEAKNNKMFQLWDIQTKDKYGFIPLGDQILPGKNENNMKNFDMKNLHQAVKNSNKFNFMGVQIQVPSQLNPDMWDKHLIDYWDKQLYFLIRYGFPLDFKASSPLHHELKNHSTANLYTDDVKAYLTEECQFGAIYGPYKDKPLDNMHFSPFLTRDKPGAPHRRVIVDLSYPDGMSVNAGVESDTYINTPFLLTLPTIDNITQKVKENGKGSLLYKIDLSRAFRHIKMDPKDYNLLGLFLDGIYYDSCLPFGFKHGSGIFQRMSDAVRYIMSKFGFQVTNYIDDIIGHSISSKANDSFQTLHKLLLELGFDISAKKIVTPSTKVTCLGIEIDTVEFTVSITADKLQEIIKTCYAWTGKHSCSKRELQSLLGKLLYISKCVKSSRFFLNRMLELLRTNTKNSAILLTDEFHRDLDWFCKFVPKFNGSAFFVHKHVHHEIELDACLQGLGARWGNEIYSIPVNIGYESMTIVHLEMLNILVAIRTWGEAWSGTTVRIHCDNQAVVSVLNTGRTRDNILAAISRNILMETAHQDICLRTVHIRGQDNQIADTLSRWYIASGFQSRLVHLLPNHVWVRVPSEALEINWDI